MDSYVYVITALLPLAASMLILQTNPYQALVLRGILGAVAALVYAVLGAADVALTEALVGTLLAITLYAVAVRSSLVLRLGVLAADLTAVESKTDSVQANHFQHLLNDLRLIFHKHHLQVELMPYLSQAALHQALMHKEIHAICAQPELEVQDRTVQPSSFYHTTTRLRRIYEILQAERVPSTLTLEGNVLDSRQVRL